jgi:hypothetical protein
MDLETDRLGDIPKEETERLILAMQALQRATSGLLVVDEGNISISEWRKLFSVILEDVNKAKSYLAS